MTTPRFNQIALPFSPHYAFTPARGPFTLLGKTYAPGEEIDKTGVEVNKLALLFTQRRIRILGAPAVSPAPPEPAPPQLEEPAAPPQPAPLTADAGNAEAKPAEAKAGRGRPRKAAAEAKAEAKAEAAGAAANEITVASNFGKWEVRQGTQVLRRGLSKDDAELFAEGARKRAAKAAETAGG